MIQNKIVVRYVDGQLLKGVTSDFFPNKDIFHVMPADAPQGSKPVELSTQNLKAIFFVKGYEGNPDYKDKKEFDSGKAPVGRKIKIVFKDGELMVGTTNGYQPGRPGFFIVPADPNSNIERCYILSAATQEVSFI
jgi:hypothetical protein